MKLFRVSFAFTLSVVTVLATTSVLRGAEPLAPARLASGGSAFTKTDRQAFVSWTLAQPEVRARTKGHRTRVLRVWTDVATSDTGLHRRATVLIRDYDAGFSLEVSAELPKGPVQVRPVAGVPPSEQEIAEGMAIIRLDPLLAALVENSRLRLIGGFHNRSSHQDDPCAVDVCLEFAFMKPNYEGPARYIIVNLSRRVVANRNFRGAKPGEAPPRMTAIQ